MKAEMVSKKLGVIIPVSKEFLRYSVPDFFAEMQPAIAEAFAIKFDQAALFGIGSPFGTGVSVMERIESKGNKIELDSLGGLYDELNAVMALLEEADKDANGFTTTRRFKKKLRGAKDENGLPIFNDPRAVPHLMPWVYQSDMLILSLGSTIKLHCLLVIGPWLDTVSHKEWNTKLVKMLRLKVLLIKMENRLAYLSKI
ncbi:hypothetical protein BsIDN1_10880 [Bacillus safensis]|uniref:Phage capsid-like C-terminal domain-containing protein n=1 Tax=Bacillus safensis TaxID=561879 RepID=A0A5S9M1K6_BACIA|nr:hypothetical protein BsIDN1_10880 [Bacillus safensis]